MSVLKELLGFVKNEDHVFIQTHNFPDHDAVASAFGLMRLFEHHGIKSSLIYEGDLQRDSLNKMIKALDIPIRHCGDFDMRSITE